MTRFIAAAALTLLAAPAWAAHPLITDDTGTQGAGGNQAEFTFDRAESGKGSSKSHENAFAFTYTRGLTDTLDFFVGGTRLDLRDPSANDGARVKGEGDSALGLKWRYAEKDGLSLGLKLTASLGTGDDARGLGAGRSTQSLLHVTQLETKAGDLLINVGLTNNGKTADERRTLWNASAAWLVPVREDLTFALDLGVAQQASKDSSKHPAYALIGLIWSLTEKIDLDIGYKHGLNDQEPDSQLGVGLTVRW
ncbi:MetA-pathway of phenol degradation, putative [Burkholderiales bacterium]